ncbi:apolipoprotein C-I [Emydura macquarii macquarii]|uniref:apolipoprotein C-I n=1 Tax=Emydura macquarii macquarii TaxID=1129001 RepID=UPI00352B107D
MTEAGGFIGSRSSWQAAAQSRDCFNPAVGPAAPGTMRPAVPLALILLALAVLADSATAEVTEPTLSQKFESFQHKLQAFADGIAEKTKAAFHDLHHSEFSEKTRNWFSEQFQKLKEKLNEKISRERAD